MGVAEILIGLIGRALLVLLAAAAIIALVIWGPCHV